jgi:hypothetical protein
LSIIFHVQSDKLACLLMVDEEFEFFIYRIVAATITWLLSGNS